MKRCGGQGQIRPREEVAEAGVETLAKGPKIFL
jgi:hypothetical protein